MNVSRAASGLDAGGVVEGRRLPARLVCFWVGRQLFGINISQVSEVIALRPITRVPSVPSWVSGIMNLRGEVVSVLDLGGFLGIGATALSSWSRMVIVRAAGRTGGILADRIDEARMVDLAQLQPPPTIGSPENQELLAGLITTTGMQSSEGSDDGGGDAASVLILVLDMERLFESERIRQFARDHGSEA